MTGDLLLETAARGELHHAIIFHGPSRETLRRTAFSVARALNCVAGIGKDDCSACTRIERGVHPDVHLIEVGEDRKLIAVEQIREIVSGAALRPYEGRTKVYIIESAEAMSVSGANALLKTLEEPTRDTTFLLLSRSPDLLLPTIRSRSQAIQIRDEQEMPASELAARDRIAMQVARLRLLFPALGADVVRDATREFVDALAAYAADANGAALLRLAAHFSEIEPAGDALALLSALCRDAAALPLDQSIDPAKAAQIRESIGTQELLAAADVAMKGVARLVVNVDARLVLEQAVAAIAKK